ncbi:PQQ-like beta-propeller repeat protein [Streptomyces sp. CA-210063]|uniref:PQQ-like beta-propeller repeat protein n=1 Tax=Streptomyces sp. CA-210063 TaxID=2801029 RepID=UPI00214BA0C7|nr:PQQ-like beta-propeller repeat protein [Streptomyces sp. CA-210063]UUU32206.1 PQQ-like beta-propeller repeat protein [Streptomyces sp. CA-210063]
MVLTVVDLRTGRLLAEGPKAEYGETLNARVASVLASDGGTVVTQLGGGAVAWNTETGAELWRQAADEQSITPLALPTADVLYASADDLGLTALDMGTKKVLASRLVPDITSELTADGDVLQLTTGGYGVLASGYDLFVFAPETKQ